MRPYKLHCLIMLILTTLAACSGDDYNFANDVTPAEVTTLNDSNPTEDTSVDDADPTDMAVLNGVLIDSAFMGVNYSTETQSGVTDNCGTFDFLAGEQITFSIGTLLFPAAAAIT